MNNAEPGLIHIQSIAYFHLFKRYGHACVKMHTHAHTNIDGMFGMYEL